jgi:hypothetical protein
MVAPGGGVVPGFDVRAAIHLVLHSAGTLDSLHSESTAKGLLSTILALETSEAALKPEESVITQERLGKPVPNEENIPHLNADTFCDRKD